MQFDNQEHLVTPVNREKMVSPALLELLDTLASLAQSGLKENLEHLGALAK